MAPLETSTWDLGTETLMASSFSGQIKCNIVENQMSYIVKYPNWQEAEQLAIYKVCLRIWTWEYLKVNAASGRM